MPEAHCQQTPAETLAKIQSVFHQLFRKPYNTVLDHAKGDPLYLPATEGTPYHQILCAHGFPQSALHEVAHWCVAGPERRQKEDFGYWYIPDGRTSSQQRAFCQVETKPQALEHHFSIACGLRFETSFDNLSSPMPPELADSFRRQVAAQSKLYYHKGLPKRAQAFRDALCQTFATKDHYKAYWQTP